MNGYGCHTYSWINADSHQRDLYEAITRGDYPSWTLKMQIMPFDTRRATGCPNVGLR